MRAKLPRSRSLGFLLVATLSLAVVMTPGLARAESATGQFWVGCRYSHSAMDDPIVFPGQPGLSHLHDFFGNKSTNADSTEQSMLAGATTCRIPSDTAGYWSPAGYLGGARIKPLSMRIYYTGVMDVGVEPIPPGLKMIGGNKDAASASENPHVSWYCGRNGSVSTPRMDAPYDCSPWAQYRFVSGVIGVVDMPNCWDGTGLEPSDTVYPTDGLCPPDFPHVLPRLSERIHFGVMDPMKANGAEGMSLASGPYYTLHGDFWNTWQRSRLDQLVADCLDAHVSCGSVIPVPKQEWSREFGTTYSDLASGVAVQGSRLFMAGSTDLSLAGQDLGGRTTAFVRAYAPGGGELWADELGKAGIVQATAVAATRSAIYVVGSTDQALHDQRYRGRLDVFVRAYDLSGHVLWTREFGSMGDDRATGVATDATGIYVAGSTDGRVGRTVWGGTDGFLRKFSFNGATVWTQQVGTSLTDEIDAVAADTEGVYVGGTTDGAFENANSGASDAFVRAYHPGGGKWWVSQIGTLGTDGITGIAAKPDAIYVAGSTDGTVGDQSLGGVDGFVARLNHGGRALWTRQFGSPGTDQVTAISATALGILVTGSTDGSFPDATLSGENDAFLVKYTLRGVEQWDTLIGTAGFDAGSGVTASSDAMYIAGQTDGTFARQVNQGDRDAFVIKVGLA
jgi:hypothetical protein